MTKPIKFFIDIPAWESLTPEQQDFSAREN